MQKIHNQDDIFGDPEIPRLIIQIDNYNIYLIAGHPIHSLMKHSIILFVSTIRKSNHIFDEINSPYQKRE
jgi:hypothetical protein